MMVLRERLPVYNRQQYDQLLLGEHWPGALLSATICLPDEARELFPLLHRVRRGSEWYVGEDLWMYYIDVEQLLYDFRQFRRVCRFEEFIPGVDARVLVDRWRQNDDPDDFERYLDQLESLFELTIREKCWLRIAL